MKRCLVKHTQQAQVPGPTQYIAEEYHMVIFLVRFNVTKENCTKDVEQTKYHLDYVLPEKALMGFYHTHW